MASTLANVMPIVRSLLNPRQPTTVNLESGTDRSSSAEIADYVDLTLGGRKTVVGTSGSSEGSEKSVRRTGASGSSLESLAASQLVISPAFKLVVILVAVLIALSGVAMTLIAIFGNPKNQALQSVLSIMSTAFTASVGAVLGLIGGKATK
jgi:hypothetical protein